MLKSILQMFDEERHVKLRIKFNSEKVYFPILKSPYVIKINQHPKHGQLIDLYLHLPNPYFVNKWYHSFNTYYLNEYRSFYRVLVCRHWPRIINEDRMMIFTKYIVPYRELRFRGPREYPPGNWKIVEYGTVYILDIYVRGFFVIYILYFERQSGILPAAINQGSVYALYFDFLKESDRTKIRKFDDDMYFRFQRIFRGKPKIEIKNEVEIPVSRFVPYFAKRVSQNMFKFVDQ